MQEQLHVLKQDNAALKARQKKLHALKQDNAALTGSRGALNQQDTHRENRVQAKAYMVDEATKAAAEPGLAVVHSATTSTATSTSAPTTGSGIATHAAARTIHAIPTAATNTRKSSTSSTSKSISSIANGGTTAYLLMHIPCL